MLVHFRLELTKVAPRIPLAYYYSYSTFSCVFLLSLFIFIFIFPFLAKRFKVCIVSLEFSKASTSSSLDQPSKY